MQLRTRRLILRPARPDDLAALHAILSNPDATRFWSTLPHQTMAETERWLQSMLDIPPGAGEDFIVEVDGETAGKAGFFRFPEIGFILHPRFWGRGLAREALHAAIDRAFDVHRLSHIMADVDPRNQRSLRTLGDLGFTEVGRRVGAWRIGDELCDSVDLMLRAEAWSRLLPPPPHRPA